MIEIETRGTSKRSWERLLPVPVGWIWIGLAMLGWSPVVALVFLFR
jgi:hypothetical protein